MLQAQTAASSKIEGGVDVKSGAGGGVGCNCCTTSWSSSVIGESDLIESDSDSGWCSSHGGPATNRSGSSAVFSRQNSLADEDNASVGSCCAGGGGNNGGGGGCGPGGNTIDGFVIPPPEDLGEQILDLLFAAAAHTAAAASTNKHSEQHRGKAYVPPPSLLREREHRSPSEVPKSNLARPVAPYSAETVRLQQILLLESPHCECVCVSARSLLLWRPRPMGTLSTAFLLFFLLFPSSSSLSYSTVTVSTEDVYRHLRTTPKRRRSECVCIRGGHFLPPKERTKVRVCKHTTCICVCGSFLPCVVSLNDEKAKPPGPRTASECLASFLLLLLPPQLLLLLSSRSRSSVSLQCHATTSLLSPLRTTMDKSHPCVLLATEKVDTFYGLLLLSRSLCTS